MQLKTKNTKHAAKQPHKQQKRKMMHKAQQPHKTKMATKPMTTMKTAPFTTKKQHTTQFKTTTTTTAAAVAPMTPSWLNQTSAPTMMFTKSFSTTTPPSFLPPTFATTKFTPTVTFQRRAFFGGANPMSALSGLMGGAAPQQKEGQMGMADMMQMMALMQKLTKNIQTGAQLDDASHREVVAFLDKIKAQSGGKLPPQYEPLFQKIVNKDPIGPDEIMQIIGLDAAEFQSLATLTQDMKSGKVNAMEYLMKVSTVMQAASQRKAAQESAAVPQIEKQQQNV